MRSMSDTRKMLKYLRTVCSGPMGGRSASSPLSGGMSDLRGASTLLEDLGDHLVERRILHADVDHRVAIENGRERVGDASAIHLQVGRRPRHADVAVAAEVVRRLFAGEV